MLSSISNHDTADAHLVDVTIKATPAHLAALNNGDIDTLEDAVNDFIRRVNFTLDTKLDVTVNFERRNISSLTPRGPY